MSGDQGRSVPPVPCRAGACALAALVLAGCFAQQADLNRVNKDLAIKFNRLDQREKEIRREIEQAHKEVDKLIGETRARLNQDILALREADLPGVLGAVERNDHQVTTLRARLEDLEHRSAALADLAKKNAASTEQRVASVEQDMKALKDRAASAQQAVQAAVTALASKVETRLQEHDKAIEEGRAQAAAHAKLMEQQVVALTRSLDGFRQALGDLGNKVVLQEKRETGQVAALSQQTAALGEQTEALTGKVNSDAKAMTEYLGKMEKNQTALVENLKHVTQKFQTRLEQQDQRLEAAVRGSEALKGQIDQLVHTINDRMQEQDRQVEVLARSLHTLSASDTGGGALVAADPAPAHEPAPPSDRQVYDQAMAWFTQGDLARAQEGFTQMLAQHPGSPLAGNAQFWLGECYYRQQHYHRAIQAYERVQTVYPANVKVPAALLKKGHAYLALKEPQQAYATWRQLVEGYPKSPEASKAMDGMKQVRQSR